MKKSFVRVSLALISTTVVAVVIFIGVFYLLTMGKEVNNTKNIKDWIDYSTVENYNGQSGQGNGITLKDDAEFSVFKDYNLLKNVTTKDILVYSGQYYVSLDLLNEVLGYSFHTDVEEGIQVISNDEYELVFRENSDEVIRSSVYGGSPFFYKLINYTYSVDDKLYIPFTSIPICFGVSLDMDSEYNVYFQTIDYLYQETAVKLNALGINLIEATNLLVYDRAIYTKDNKKGIISSDGDVVIPAEFDLISELYQDVYLVKKGDQYGLYSYKGDIILECKYDNLSLLDYYNKLVVVKEGMKYGMINQTGAFVLPIIYSEIGTNALTNLSSGMEDSMLILGDCITVKLLGSYGIMSITGEEVLPPEYDSIGYVKYNLEVDGSSDEYFLELYELDAVVVGVNGLYGAVNRQGHFVVDCAYRSIHFGEAGWEFK